MSLRMKSWLVVPFDICYPEVNFSSKPYFKNILIQKIVFTSEKKRYHAHIVGNHLNCDLINHVRRNSITLLWGLLHLFRRDLCTYFTRNHGFSGGFNFYFLGTFFFPGFLSWIIQHWCHIFVKLRTYMHTFERDEKYTWR